MTRAATRDGAPAGTLAQSREYCGDLTRREARNFYYGLKLLPEPKRGAMYALYGYMRLVDDIADDDAQRRTLAQRRADLDQWEAQTRQALAAAAGDGALPGGHPVWPAFADMVRTYRVPAQVFTDMIAGQRQDLEPVTMATFAALATVWPASWAWRACMSLDLMAVRTRSSWAWIAGSPFSSRTFCATCARMPRRRAAGAICRPTIWRNSA